LRRLIDLPPRGPQQPVEGTPARPHPSVRRTSTIDCTQEVGSAGARLLVIDGRARDLVTHPDGRTVEAEVASVRAVLDGFLRTVVEIDTDPPAPSLSALVGASALHGFRKELAVAAAPEAEVGSLLHLLLDDLVGAALVAGYGEIQSGAMAASFEVNDAARERLAFQRDLCAGWAAEGGMMQAAEATGTAPIPPPTPGPDLEVADDPVALHAVAPLALHATRRRRRLDLSPAADGGTRFDVHFRDSAGQADGEGIIHEYTLHGEVHHGVLSSAGACAHVLPWVECPGALASVGRAVGHPLEALRDLVRRQFRGTSTCTHLNDSVRSLADLDVLAALLP
jgi:hypothetical protein